MKKYDLIIIGWGKGGKTLAASLGKQGWKIALIEKDSLMYGGTCINVGCLPSKAFAHSAQALDEVRKLDLATDYELNNKFYQASLKHKREFVKKLNNKNFSILDTLENVDLYLGTASFKDSKVISVQLKDELIELTGDKIIINTGASFRKLDIKGIENTQGIIYSNQALELEQLPKEMLVIGAGFIGLEFANYFNQFGSKVTVMQHNDSFMPSEDLEDSNYVKELLTKQGIDLKFNTQVLEFKNQNNQVVVTYKQNDQTYTQTFDNVLIAAGRVPNTQNLNLEAVGIETKNQAIVVNDYLETTVKDVYAIGDVKGGPMFTYVSLDDSRILLSNWLNTPKKYTLKDRDLLPWSTFLSPTYARVGYNEKEATAKNIKYIKKYLPTSGIPKAHVINQTDGFNKILINENDEIIGATLMNYEAHEMINILTLAIKLKLKYQYLRDFIYTHPTFTESLNDILK
ncbi:dihydrolipoyl dehydrogenase family protein [Mycoplasma hafezii]|uniref:dihydrolipoyl dehydrogenase family protein n=1 Tax=Mycoplasma hafezii TaxID=525886 RepID=UPI003CEF7C0A